MIKQIFYDTNRKNFIDNLKIICILMLFPYHTGMIYNAFFNDYYVYYKNIKIIDYFLMIINWWYMPLMFALAGISAFYALKKRSNKEFLKERFLKLLIPFVCSIILVLPSIGYIAEIFHSGYMGSYFSYYILYFTKFNNIKGFTGGFTPSHLWFIINLFCISVLCLPIMRILLKYKLKLNMMRINLTSIYMLFSIIFIYSIFLIIGIYSLGQNFIIFFMGFIILSDESILKKLNDNKWLCTIIAILSIIIMLYIYSKTGYIKKTDTAISLLFLAFESFTTWSIILAIIALSQSFLNKTNKLIKYFSNISFQVYIFHHTFILFFAFYVIKYTKNILFQYILIMVPSFILTLITCEIVRRVRFLSFMFGADYKKTQYRK